MSYQAATSTDRYPSSCSRPRSSRSSDPSVSAARTGSTHKCTCTCQLRSMRQCWSQHKCQRSDTDSMHKRLLQMQAGKEEADQSNKTGTTVDKYSPALLHTEAVAAVETKQTASAVAAMLSKHRVPLKQPQRKPCYMRHTLHHPHRRRRQQALELAQHPEPPQQHRRCSRSDKQGSAA